MTTLSIEDGGREKPDEVAALCGLAPGPVNKYIILVATTDDRTAILSNMCCLGHASRGASVVIAETVERTVPCASNG